MGRYGGNSLPPRSELTRTIQGELIMRRLILCMLFLLGIATHHAVQATLQSGWNLFSPVLGSDQDAQTHFTILGLNPAADISKVWSYDPNVGWTKFVPGEDNSTVGRFQNLKVGGGYWVFMNTQRTVELSDAFSTYSVDLSGSGWNLIGLGSSQNVAIDADNFLNEANFSTGDVNSIRKIWGFNGSTWKSYAPSSGSNNLDSLDPGLGYWFLILSDLEINSQNVSLSDLFPPTCPGCPTIGN
jgi:hypothetical protein